MAPNLEIRSDDMKTMSVASNLSEMEKVHGQFGENEATYKTEVLGSNLQPVDSNDQFRKMRDKIGRFVNDDRIANFIMLLIIVNSIMLGLATFPFVYNNPSVQDAFDLTDKIFLIIFTIEVIMQLIYHDIALFKDGWLSFDFFVVILSWAFASLQGIRAFRIFRSLRIVQRYDSMKALLQAISNVIPQLFAILALLGIIFYIFAVLFTSLFIPLGLDYTDGKVPQPDECYYYFQSLHGSLFTLFNVMTLDAWGFTARTCMKDYAWAWAPFVAYVMVSSFVIFSLIIAVICDAVAELHASKKEDEHISKEKIETEKKDKLNKGMKELSLQVSKLLEVVG